MKTRTYAYRPEEHNKRSASVIVPELMRRYSPRSVVDVGCGLGTWLSVFAEHHLTDLVGYDGDHLDRQMLTVPTEMVLVQDLEQELRSSRTFDLALSLEVAEHISPEHAGTFVRSLCHLSQTVVFSAAIPGQGGQNHLNEQWPSYWQSLFLGEGFTMHDVFRDQFWEEGGVDYWYKQNMFLVTGPRSPFYLPQNQPLRRLVHPDLLRVYRDLFWNLAEGKAGTLCALKILVKSLFR